MGIYFNAIFIFNIHTNVLLVPYFSCLNIQSLVQLVLKKYYHDGTQCSNIQQNIITKYLLQIYSFKNKLYIDFYLIFPNGFEWVVFLCNKA